VLTGAVVLDGGAVVVDRGVVVVVVVVDPFESSKVAVHAAPTTAVRHTAVRMRRVAEDLGRSDRPVGVGPTGRGPAPVPDRASAATDRA
jgi:hypothetical protein